MACLNKLEWFLSEIRINQLTVSVTRAKCYKTFFPPSGLYSPVYFLWVRLGAYPSEAPFSYPTLGEALALLAKIRLGRKGLPRTNALTYYKNL
jgi:hypothetical protein